MSVPGFSEDYAHLAYGLLELYEADFDPSWAGCPLGILMDLLDDFFLDPDLRGLFPGGSRSGGAVVARQEHL